MKFRYLLLFTLSALSANNIFAGNFYFNLGAGGFVTHSNSSYTEDSSALLYSPTSIGTSLFSLPAVEWKNKFKNGLDANIAAGYQFTPNWRSDIEFLYQNSESDTTGTYGWKEVNSSTIATYSTSNSNPITKVSSNVNLYSFLTNGYYDFRNSSKWTPSIGGGIGFAWINSPGKNANNILNVDDPLVPLVQTAPILQKDPSLSSTAFAWQIKAALSYAVSAKTSVALQYRLFGTSRFKAGNSVFITNPGTPDASAFYISQHGAGSVLTNSLEFVLRLDT